MCEPVTLAALATAATTAGSIGAGATVAGVAGATATTAGLTAMQALALGASVGGTVLSAGSAYQQGQVAKQVGRNNAQMAEAAAQDAQRRGEEQAIDVQRKGAALKSAQRVSLASRGLDLQYGTAADLQDQTDFFTQSDVATTRTNAGREAYNLRARGQAEMQRGRADATNAMLQAGGSLLGGAGQVSDKWNSYRGSSPSSSGLPSWYTSSTSKYSGGPLPSWYPK
tara:strand:- start:1738 stop:2415 length:678 start_codon:yes stop_codon:yes gene_type:complete